MNTDFVKWITTAAVTVVVACAVSVIAQQPPATPDAMLGAALHQAEVEGNLDKAIATYKQVLADKRSSRAMVATALLRMAEAYQKLGKTVDARVAYERVVQEFGEQTAAAESARGRLGLVSSRSVGIQQRPVWTGHDVDRYLVGSMSLDGRYLSHEGKDGEMYVRELATGAERKLTDRAANLGSGYYSAISPDGNRVAFSWNRDDGGVDLRVVSTFAPARGTPRVLYNNPDVTRIRPFGWSPDARSLAVQVGRTDRTAQIGLIDVEDGSLKVLKSVQWNGSSKMAFSPDGRYLAFDQATQGPARDVFVLAIDGSREVPVVQHPADDALAGWSGGLLLFTSDRNRDFGLWGLTMSEGRQQPEPELLKSGLGQVTILGISASGSIFYGTRVNRTEAEVASVSFDTGMLTSEVQTTGVYGPFPSWSPDGKEVMYLSGPQVVGIRSLDTGATREIRTQFAGRLFGPRWAPDGGTIVVQGFQNGVYGIHLVDPLTSAVTPLKKSELEEQVFQPQWTPDGKGVVYRHHDTQSRTYALMLRDLATGNERNLVQPAAGQIFGFDISPNGRDIAFWREDQTGPRNGLIANMVLTIVSIAGGQQREVLRAANPTPSAGWIAWTPNSDALLYGVVIGEPDFGTREVRMIPREGGIARRIDLTRDNVRSLEVHAASGKLLWVSGKTEAEVWVLEHVVPQTPRQ